MKSKRVYSLDALKKDAYYENIPESVLKTAETEIRDLMIRLKRNGLCDEDIQDTSNDVMRMMDAFCSRCQVFFTREGHISYFCHFPKDEAKDYVLDEISFPISHFVGCEDLFYLCYHIDPVTFKETVLIHYKSKKPVMLDVTGKSGLGILHELTGFLMDNT